MTEAGNNGGRDGDPPADREPESPRRTTLRRVEGPLDVVGGPPPVQLLREYKGLTVADMLRDEIVDRLPGQVRTAIHHIRAGDYEAAERALPGDFGPMLPGPGAARANHRRLVIWLSIGAGLLAAALASYWF